MFTVVSTGLILGLAGSLHCVGMCGPLSLGLPMREASPARRAIALGLYHAGRIFAYSIIGMLFGLMGRKFYLAGMQQGLSIALGIFMLVIAVQYFIFRYVYQPVFIKKYYNWLQQAMIRLMKKNFVEELPALWHFEWAVTVWNGVCGSGCRTKHK